MKDQDYYEQGSQSVPIDEFTEALLDEQPVQPRVKHLIQFLQEEFNPESPISLNHDASESPHTNDPVEIIRQSSLFLSFPLGNKEPKSETSILIQN